MATCSVKNCPKKLFAKGLCQMHYRRVARHGTTELVDPVARARDVCARIAELMPRLWKEQGFVVESSAQRMASDIAAAIREEMDP